MTQVQQIKAEIERRINQHGKTKGLYNFGKLIAYQSMLAFINSLTEQEQ